MKRFSLLVFMVSSLMGLRLQAQSPEEQYIYIYNLIQQADRLSGSGDSNAARSKYLEADTGLKKLQTTHPNWNDKVVKFRIRYIEERLGSVLPKVPPLATPEKAPEKKAESFLDEREAQIRSLREVVQRLEAEKVILQTKLKEALTAQPAAVDPRELAKAEEKIRSVEKEKELLRVSLEQEKKLRANLVEPGAVEDLKRTLAEANRRLVEQREAAATLAREKQILEERLNQPSNDNAIQALRSENESLKKQLVSKSTKRESVIRSDKTEKELTEARVILQSNANSINKLRDERTALEKTKSDLEKRLADVMSAASASNKASVERMKRLEKERNDLQARLKQTEKQPPKLATKKPDSADHELAGLRARLAALEAQKVPFSPEELSLFRQPVIEPSKVTANPPKNTVNDLPAGAASLVAEAESAFRSRRYAEAEKKYQEVLRFDDNNASTLANLAASQLEQKKLDEAEVTLKRALATEPNDAHAMTLLGIVKLRQEKFDEAFEALSKSVQIDPQNAETQNYLGITLSQKGKRGAAETALRKAIQLSPSYGSAHNNLAVIYATQQPPFLELARWHYQRALAAGHPKNSDLEKLLDRTVVSGGK